MKATVISHRYGEANPDHPFAHELEWEPHRDDVIKHARDPVADVVWLSLTVEQRRHTSEGLVLVRRGVVIDPFLGSEPIIRQRTAQVGLFGGAA